MRKRTDFLTRKRPLERSGKRIERNLRRTAKRARQYKAFIQGPVWRAQRARVLQRDGWQCTHVERVDGELQRCGYTRDDGPLHAHHERYHPRGLEYTPDKDIRTGCPRHHARWDRERWWAAPRMKVQLHRPSRQEPLDAG